MPPVSAVPRVMVSAPVPPVRVSTLETVAGVGDVGEGQLVGAGAEIDAAAGERRAQRDGVGAGAAGERLDVGDGGVLAKLPKGQVSVPAPRSIDAVGDAAPRVMVSAPCRR